MGFASIGRWIDKKIESAGKSWRGSQAKKTIDDVMSRSFEAAGKVSDRVSIEVREAGDNFKENLERINRQNKDSGFLKKAVEVGKQGGLVGLMFKKNPEDSQQKAVKAKEPEKTVQQKKSSNLKPQDQINGWNLAG